jgi:tRNA pseudouridine38-40 synthase
VLWLWYRGARFRGWQRQVQGPPVQEQVEAALHGLGVSGGLAAAGRTDRGVHARMQVASLRVPPGTDLLGLAGALRGPDWGCAIAVPAAPGFHAQWTPSTKEYRYRFAAGAPPRDWAGFAWDLSSEERGAGKPIDPATLGEALALAVGTRDFFAFHAASSVRRPRTLAEVALVHRPPDLWELRLRGDGFGRYQVRALVGGAALVASGQLEPALWRAALEEARPFPGLLAPPHGLTLWAVSYPGTELFGAREDLAPRGPPFDPASGVDLPRRSDPPAHALLVGDEGLPEERGERPFLGLDLEAVQIEAVERDQGDGERARQEQSPGEQHQEEPQVHRVARDAKDAGDNQP